MDLSFLFDYMSLVIIGICLCIGYILKSVVPSDKVNKYIPLVVAIIGIFFEIWSEKWTVSPQIILTGMFSGLASTGLYEAFKNLIEKAEPKSIENVIEETDSKSVDS